MFACKDGHNDIVKILQNSKTIDLNAKETLPRRLTPRFFFTLAAPKMSKMLQTRYTRRIPIQTKKKMNIISVILTTSSSSLGGKLD